MVEEELKEERDMVNS